MRVFSGSFCCARELPTFMLHKVKHAYRVPRGMEYMDCDLLCGAGAAKMA